MSTPASPRDRARQRLTMDYEVELIEQPETKVVLPQPAGKRRQEAENDDQPA